IACPDLGESNNRFWRIRGTIRSQGIRKQRAPVNAHSSNPNLTPSLNVNDEMLRIDQQCFSRGLSGFAGGSYQSWKRFKGGSSTCGRALALPPSPARDGRPCGEALPSACCVRK